MGESRPVDRAVARVSPAAVEVDPGASSVPPAAVVVLRAVKHNSLVVVSVFGGKLLARVVGDVSESPVVTCV